MDISEFPSPSKTFQHFSQRSVKVDGQCGRMISVTACGKQVIMSRINLSQRIIIESGIYQRLSLTEIARRIGVSRASVSKEIRMNRTPAKGSKPHGHDCRFANECEEKNLCCNFDCKRKCVWCFDFNCRELCSKYDNSPCSVLQKPPYVCNVCSRRRNCKCDRFYYMANQADAMSKKRYSKARKKTHADKDELKRIDSIVSPLIRKGQPISHIYAEHGDEIGVSPRTLYRYIDMGCLKVNNFDLRRKVSYKQRKKKREESEAFQNQKFRQTRTYLDFVKYMEKHPDINVVEMDTVKGCREQGKRMLTLLFRKTNLMLIMLMRDGKAATVVEQFDYLTSLVGVENFRKIFPVILTDNGSEFKYTQELEKTDQGVQRTRLFYCDPQASWQKAQLEKNHEYIRYVLRKGKSFNPYTQDDMVLLMNHINSTRREKLGGKSPFEAEDRKEVKLLLKMLGLHAIPSDEVNLNPTLLTK